MPYGGGRPSKVVHNSSLTLLRVLMFFLDSVRAPAEPLVRKKMLAYVIKLLKS